MNIIADDVKENLLKIKEKYEAQLDEDSGKTPSLEEAIIEFL